MKSAGVAWLWLMLTDHMCACKPKYISKLSINANHLTMCVLVTLVAQTQRRLTPKVMWLVVMWLKAHLHLWYTKFLRYCIGRDCHDRVRQQIANAKSEVPLVAVPTDPERCSQSSTL